MNLKEIFGRGERIRTSGLYVPNVALYQAKLHPDGVACESLKIRPDALAAKMPIVPKRSCKPSQARWRWLHR